MKPYTILLCFLFLSVYANAQYQYVPMPTTNATWSAINQIAVMRASNCYKYQYKITGDYTVNGTDTFYVVEKLTKYMGYDAVSTGRPDPVEEREFVQTCVAGRPFEQPITGGKTDTLWAIEKSKKIYVLDSAILDTAIHKAFIDFNLSSVGQTISRYKQWSVDTVLAIDTVSINGTLRKRIVTTFIEDIGGKKPDTLIEGIGSLRFGLGFKELMNEGNGHG